MNLIFIGYRASGKTTVGALVARRLGWRFVDLDEQIIQRAGGKSIKEIFAAEGEAGFRKREREAFEGLRRVKCCVIALGGGAPLDPEIRGFVKRLGRVIWLKAPAAVLWSRINQDPSTGKNRPDLGAGGLAEVEALLTQREAVYQSMANHILDTVGDTPEQLSEATELWFMANDAD